jgi:3-hydroxyisobutyrate dehydrogenase
MTKIAFLGLGAMGSRMAARLIAAGHDVTVWNRTPKSDTLPGARVAGTPRAAAIWADVVISMVRDDAASSAVWLDTGSGALGAMARGALGIEASTVTPMQARRLHEAAAAQGIGFLDSPLAGSRPQAEAGQLIFMAGGAPEDFARGEPVLGAMGGAAHHAGTAGAGATVKLMVNTLFGAQLAIMAELMGLAERVGVDPARAVEIVGATPVVSLAVKGAAGAMLARAFAPAFPIDLVEKDFGLAVETARESGAMLPVSEAVREVFGQAKAEGLGGDNITGIVQRYMPGLRQAAD